MSTFAIAVSLAVVVLTPARAYSQIAGPHSAGSLTVRVAGQETVLSFSTLAQLPRAEVRIAGETGDSVSVSGVRLWDVLQHVGAPAAQASGRQRAVQYVRLTGRDGQQAVLALVEVDPSFSTRAALIGNRRAGQALSAAEGAWRVFIPTDLRHARWIRDLMMIEVVALTP